MTIFHSKLRSFVVFRKFSNDYGLFLVFFLTAPYSSIVHIEVSLESLCSHVFFTQRKADLPNLCQRSCLRLNWRCGAKISVIEANCGSLTSNNFIYKFRRTGVRMMNLKKEDKLLEKRTTECVSYLLVIFNTSYVRMATKRNVEVLKLSDALCCEKTFRNLIYFPTETRTSVGLTRWNTRTPI